MTSIQLPLFDDFVTDIPVTEGIKYAGSKLKLIPHILDFAKQTNATSVLDGFSGSTRVSQALAQMGFRVVCNDISVWSKVFGECYLLNQFPQNHYLQLIEYLNAIPPKDGWFTEHYGGDVNDGSAVQLDGLKKPWQTHNTRKLDAIRDEIDNLHLTPIERSVALTSLILALDKVDNTLGHFVAYLREWSPRSYNEMHLELPRLFFSAPNHQVFCGDIFDLSDAKVDLAYFDPPYGSNNEKMPPSRIRYASYYHLWTTICLNDKPELFGKSKRRIDSSDSISASVFEEFRKNSNSGHFFAVEAINRLIKSTPAKWIILSYSSGGRATAEEIDKILRENGEVVEVKRMDYRRNVMAEMKWTNEWLSDTSLPNQEFLFLLYKGR